MQKSWSFFQETKSNTRYLDHKHRYLLSKDYWTCRANSCSSRYAFCFVGLSSLQP
jgi:hypothetical protein